MTHRGRFIHFSSQAPRRSRCALVHHSSSQAPRLLALRARPPQLVASSSAARAARSSTTARRKLLGGSRCALAHHSSSQAPRWLALRAHPPQLVVASSALALRARLLGGSRCALARVVRSPATARRKLIVRWYSLMDEAESFLFLLFAADFALPAARLDPRGIFLVCCPRLQTWCGASVRPRRAAVKRLGSNVCHEPQEPPSPLTSQTTPRTQGHNSARLRRARGPFESGG